MNSAQPFNIVVGQFWRKDGVVYHVPRVERKNLPPHHWEVIRCTETPSGYTWVFPREPADEPTWSLADFQDATLVETKTQAVRKWAWSEPRRK